MDDRYQDRKLVDGARSGDRACFERLFQLHHQAVYALAYGTLREKNTAAGVLQDTFQTAWGSLHELPEGESFGLWVQRLCFLRCSALLRASGRAPELQDDAARELLTDADPAAFRLPQPYAVRPELKAALERAVAALPDRQRQALVLYYNNGLSEADAGAVLGVSAAQTRSYLAHARREIVRRLRQEERAAGLSLPWGEEDTVPFRDTMTAEILGGMLSTTSVGAILAAILASKGGAGKAAAGGAAKAGSLKSAISAIVGKGGSAGAAAKAGGMSLAAKAGGMSLAAKTAVGLTAAAVVVGGGYGVKTIIDNNRAEAPEPEDERGAVVESVKLLDTVRVYRADGMLWFSETYDYDDNSFVIRSTASEYEYDGSVLYEDMVRVYEYDEDGRVLAVRSDIDPESYYRRYEYDEAGRLTLEYFGDSNGNPFTRTYAYDEDGNLIRMNEGYSDSSMRSWSCVETQNDDGSRDVEMELEDGPEGGYPLITISHDADGRLTYSGAELGGHYFYYDEKNLTLTEFAVGDGVEPGSPDSNLILVLMDSENRIYHEVYLCGADASKYYDEDGYLVGIESSDGRYAEFTYRDPSDEPEEEPEPSPEPEDTSWKQAYLDFLQEFADSEGRKLEDYTYSLTYIDDDSIPELVLSGKYSAAGSVVCSYHDGEVSWEYAAAWGVQVLEREGLWLDSYMHSGCGREVVWELRDGHFTELGTGTFEADIQNYDDVTYYWNDVEVPETTYKDELARLFDADHATYIDTGVEYDAFTAQLRS